MGRNKDLFKNTSYVVVGSIGAKIVGFLMLPLYTRWLSPSDYGITDVIDTYANLLMCFVALDISDAIFIFPVGETYENIKKYYSTGFYFTLFCCILCAGVFWLLSFLNMEGGFYSNLWLIYGVLISSLFQRYTQDFCRGIKKMSVFSFTGIIQSFTIAGSSFLLVPYWGVLGFVLSCILGNCLSGFFAFIYSGSYRYLSFLKFDFGYLKSMLIYSVPLVPTGLMWWMVSGLNRPLLETYSGFFAIGLFAVANKLPSLLNMVFGFFQKAWVVTVVEEYKKEDFSAYYNKIFRVVFSMQTLLCIVITIFSKCFIHLMTTDEYYEAWIYVPILSVAVLFSNTSSFCGTIFSASRKSKYILYSVIVGGIAAVLFNFVLIPLWGLWGACIAICLSHLANSISRILFSGKMVRFTNTNYIIMQLLIIGLAFGGVISENRPLTVILIFLAFALYYLTNKALFIEIMNFVIRR